MDVDEARRACAAGKLSEAVLEPAAEGNGWWVLVRGVDGSLSRITDHGGTAKLYHDMDTATEVAKALGFDSVRVEERF